MKLKEDEGKSERKKSIFKYADKNKEELCLNKKQVWKEYT